MSGGVGACVLVAAAIGAGAAVYSADSQRSASNTAADMAKNSADKQLLQAQKTATQADEANNNANKKSADAQTILSAAQQSSKSGASGTMLTGATGATIDPTQLGKNTLLGA